MSLFGKMNHAFAKAMRMKIWPFYAISVSTCCVKKNRLVLASMPNVLRLVGTTIIFSAFWMGLIRCDCPGTLTAPAKKPIIFMKSNIRMYQKRGDQAMKREQELLLSKEVLMHEAEQAFRQVYPTFERTIRLDELRVTEYGRLDKLGHIYLDYTGGGLYAECQLREHFDLLSHHVFGNPHSLNPTSRAMTELVEQARASVLDFFHASPSEYTVIFTCNATHALKLVGEAYPFQPGGQFLLLFDNHNSVNGIREFARARGASFTYLPVMAPELRVEEALLHSFLESGS